MNKQLKNIIEKLRDLVIDLNKVRRVQRFKIGDKVLFMTRGGLWDEATIVSPRVAGMYDIRGVDGRRRLKNGRDLRPLS